MLPPYENWTWNNEKNEWVAPIPYPEDGKNYFWESNSAIWKIIEIEDLEYQEQNDENN
jgi:hypothetical protein